MTTEGKRETVRINLILPREFVESEAAFVKYMKEFRLHLIKYGPPPTEPSGDIWVPDAVDVPDFANPDVQFIPGSPQAAEYLGTDYWMQDGVRMPYPTAAQHTYTPQCDGFHSPGPCPTLKPENDLCEVKT